MAEPPMLLYDGIEEYSLGVLGMSVVGCRGPDSCARWARAFAERMAALLPRAQQLHEEFLKRLLRGGSRWTIGLHAAERQSLRAIGDAELQVVIECGEVCQVSFEQ